MWGFFSSNNIVTDTAEEHMGETYRKKSLSINFAFFLLILASFTFINLIFIKNISHMNDEIIHSEHISNDSLRDSKFTKQSNLFIPPTDKSALLPSLNYSPSFESKLILFALNLLFFIIVVYTIGSFTFTVNSIKSIEDRFINEREKNKELKRNFKEKSRYIRHRFKRKLIDLKSKKNILMNSIKGFLDEHIGETQSDIYSDELKNLKLNLHMNEVGTWTWDIEKDIVTIDRACYKLLNLKNSAFVGGYSLFLNFFDKNSSRKLKKDISYAMKFNTAFETKCSMKISNQGKGLILKGNLVTDSKLQAKKIQGVLMQTECPNKAHDLQKQFLNQPIALFAILDRDFCFEFVNPAWLESTGYSIQELKKYPMFNFIHQREKRLFLNNLHVLKQDNDGSVKNLKYRFRLFDGNFVNLNLTVSFENNRYYIAASPVQQKRVKEKSNYNFNFQETWDQQYLKS